MSPDFVGAKIALICGDQILTYLRDDTPGLPWAGWWDLPGGGRERDETAEECLLREVEEEFGLALGAGTLLTKLEFPSMTDPSRASFFFVGRLSVADIAAIVFGDEGQRWEMMRVAAFLALPSAIPEMRRRVAIALGER